MDMKNEHRHEPVNEIVKKVFGTSTDFTADDNRENDVQIDQVRLKKRQRNRRKRQNQTKSRRVRQWANCPLRHKMSEEERSRVRAFLDNFEKNPEPILAYARSVVKRDRRAFLLSREDQEDIIGEFGRRVIKYFDRFQRAKSLWGYLATCVHHSVSDHLRRRRFKLQITFRCRARIKTLLGTLRLNGAEIVAKPSKGDGKTHFGMWVTASQAAELRGDPRVESFVVIFNGRNHASIDLAHDIPDSEPNHDGWQRRHDVLAAYETLKSELPKPARVFELRWLLGKAWKEVAKAMRLTVRQCQNLLRKFIRRFKERFPELGES